MLQAAVHMDLNGSDEKLSTEDSHIRIQVNLINDGAGHNVPTGFSQEREVWIELTVRDAAGDIYSSGYLVDKAHSTSGEIEPDGRLNDEDLNHRIVLVNYETVEAEFSDGPDVNQRPSGVNLGLVSLTNDFVYVDDNGEHHPVLTPFHANHMNNDNALAPFEERAYFYDVPFPERDISGDIQVEARLLYRSFPPKFLRILAHHSPDLVDEQMIDRNEIVVMQEQSLRIRNIIP
jgi:hypothetical protein